MVPERVVLQGLHKGLIGAGICEDVLDEGGLGPFLYCGFRALGSASRLWFPFPKPSKSR